MRVHNTHIHGHLYLETGQVCENECSEKLSRSHSARDKTLSFRLSQGL